MDKALKVGIIGLGWLGFPLAHALAKNYQVWGGNRSNRPQDDIEVYTIDLKQPESVTLLPEHTDVLIICVAMRGFSENELDAFMNQCKYHFTSVKQLLFTSSTSVYASSPIIIDEESPLIQTPNNSLMMEHLLTKYFPHKSCILRLAGLIDETRNPVYYLVQKINESPNARVNLVHREDVQLAIQRAIQLNLTGVYNICYPDHPSRQSYYQRKALELGLSVPVFKLGDLPDKQISSQKFIEKADFSYQYPI